MTAGKLLAFVAFIVLSFSVHAQKSKTQLQREKQRNLEKIKETERILDEPDWLLVPVPLHRRRKRERGFNQSLELAEIVASHSPLKVADELVRTRYTTMQASLSRKERLSNMSGAFRLTRRALRRGIFKDRAVLLVDDVFTTGSTAHECAGILKRDGGARKVAAFTVARG